jgi:hypothetical protein
LGQNIATTIEERNERHQDLIKKTGIVSFGQNIAIPKAVKS